MFKKSARFYDALYQFKDYGAACREIHELVSRQAPHASTLLDVACGSGQHLAHLRTHYPDVAGVDVNPELLAIARARLPGVPLHAADMAAFDLDRRFDVVTCLFSSIAYVRTPERLVEAIAAMRRHLAPRGILLVEPWFSPDRFWTHTITANLSGDADLRIAWMYTSEREGGIGVLDMQFLVGTPDGVEHFTERHELGLFTHEAHLDAFESAGLRVEHIPDSCFKRGFYAGIAPDA